MATYRTVYMSFWTDPKVDDGFTPEDKYFYIYLLTNPHTNLCGCYEISMKQMVQETGYNEDTVKRLIARMETEHNVIRYDPNTKEILILNWHKYNWSKSEKTLLGVATSASSIKSHAFFMFVVDTLEVSYGYSLHTPCEGHPCPMDASAPDTAPVTDTVSVSVPDTVTGKSNRFTRPTFEQVEEYCNSEGYQINVKKFIAFYDMKGWRVGKDPMKDWKGAVRNWYYRDAEDKAMKGTALPRKEQEKMNALADLERRMKESEARERGERI